MALTSLSRLVRDAFVATHIFLSCVSAYVQLSDDSLKSIPSGGEDFDILHGALLAPILIPRVAGTPGSEKAQEHFVNFFTQQLPKWTLEWQNSSSTTPATGDKQIPFRNLIFRRDPPWAAPGDVGRLTLVAHYDSLYRPEGFIGATDSAAPCAMLMHAARSIDQALERKWNAMTASGEGGTGLEEEKGVQIIFLDGEEAFLSWSATDSLYGARCVGLPSSSRVHR
jgi:glutaminyl-peptide cyclotransferase